MTERKFIEAKKIGKRGFYTDGTNVYKRSFGSLVVLAWEEPNQFFVGKGVEFANVTGKLPPVRLVEIGETFLDGRVSVLNAKVLSAESFKTIGAKYGKDGRCYNAEEVTYEPETIELTM